MLKPISRILNPYRFFSRGSFSSVNKYKVYSFGSGLLGCLGNGKIDDIDFPQEVPLLDEIEPSRVYAGWGHSAVLSVDNRVIVFGRTHGPQDITKTYYYHERFPKILNFYLKTFQKSIVPFMFPTELVFPHDKIVNISCGAASTFFLNDKGELFGFGSNDNGQIGVNENSNEILSVRPLLTITEPIKQIASGFQHHYTLAESGVLYGWGKNKYGQLLRPFEMRFIERPITLNDLLDFKIKEVSSGMSHGVVLTEDGNVYTFGKYQSDEINVRKELFQHSYEINHLFTNSPIKHIHSFNHLNLLQDIHGQLYMFGLIDQRFLHLVNGKKDGVLRNQKIPLEVDMTNIKNKNFKKFCIDYLDFYGLTDDGEIYKWNWCQPPQLYESTKHLYVHDFATGWQHKLVLGVPR